MSVVTMKELLEAGVHFGHRTRRWNPKMRPYIFTERSKIHIIDLQQTMLRLDDYYALIRDKVAKGGTVLFVGTKRQAQAIIRSEAERCHMPYVNQRWLGGTLTNWATIKQRIDYLLQLERRYEGGEFLNFSKKEQLNVQREIDKLNRRLGGLKVMAELPDMVFVVDTHLEDLTVNEASKLKIPIIGMVDTNTDPDPIEYVIPSNDDAIRAVKLIVTVMADAVEEGRRVREVEMVDTGQVSEQELADMEQYLGPSTLAKLQTVEIEEDGVAADEAEGTVVVDEVIVAEDEEGHVVVEEVIAVVDEEGHVAVEENIAVADEEGHVVVEEIIAVEGEDGVVIVEDVIAVADEDGVVVVEDTVAVIDEAVAADDAVAVGSGGAEAEETLEDESKSGE